MKTVACNNSSWEAANQSKYWSIRRRKAAPGHTQPVFNILVCKRFGRVKNGLSVKLATHTHKLLNVSLPVTVFNP
jgi:hypothetical protein